MSSISSLILWAGLNFFQNFSHTYVSRARSSGSLLRHFKASIFANGIYIASQMIMLGAAFEYLAGRHGVPLQVLYGTSYTIFTVSGSLAAHHWAMKTERGKTAVGSSKLYAQVPVAEWQAVKSAFEAYTEHVGKDGLTGYQKDLN